MHQKVQLLFTFFYCYTQEYSFSRCFYDLMTFTTSEKCLLLFEFTQFWETIRVEFTACCTCIVTHVTNKKNLESWKMHKQMYCYEQLMLGSDYTIYFSLSQWPPCWITAIRFSRILVGKLATLPVWPWPIISDVPCVPLERTVMKHVVGVVRVGEKCFQNLTCYVRVSWDLPDATLLLFDYVTLQGQFISPNIQNYSRITSISGWHCVVWSQHNTGATK